MHKKNASYGEDNDTDDVVDDAVSWSSWCSFDF